MSTAWVIDVCASSSTVEPLPCSTHFYKALTSLSWNSDDHINQEANSVNTTEAAPVQKIHEETNVLWKQPDQHPQFPRDYHTIKFYRESKLDRSQGFYF